MQITGEIALSAQRPFVEETAEALCRRIELYRRYMRQGVDAALAAAYLRAIAAAEAALVELYSDAPGRPRRVVDGRAVRDNCFPLSSGRKGTVHGGGRSPALAVHSEIMPELDEFLGSGLARIQTLL
jgi:hypothetical protein